MGTLVADLSQGRSLIETHISWILLGEHDVYKIKKPVDFGFLNFTTLERRRAACLDEVTLNCRLTRDVYHGVQPVVLGRDGVHQIGGDGTVVDYCVHMRRLRETARLDQLEEEGSLDAELIARLAEHLAGFHAAAETNGAIAAMGQVEVIRGNVEENFAQTRAHLEEFITAEQAQHLEKAQLGFLDEHAALLSQRITGGRIRDGHGDLRLEHVYWIDDQFQILDCIEFNQRFRYADVCADLAFLTMDLRHASRPELAETLLAKYAEASCDFQLYRLAAFYESYRAIVRAKVNLFTATNLHVPDEQRRRAHREAERYLAQALAATKPRAPIAVIAVGGLIAAGKSHTCSLLSRWLTCPVVASDRLRKHHLQVTPHTPLHEPKFEGAYSAEVTRRTYEALRQNAEHVLMSGRSVILDASFRSFEERAELAAWCRHAGAKLYFVECVAPHELLRTRLRERAKAPSVSDGREAIFDAFLESYEPPNEFDADQRCTLDTSLPLDEQCRVLQTFVSSLS